MIEPGIVALTLADAATAALIGTRIYPLLLPDDCPLPAVSYHLISTVDSYTLDGPLSLVQVRLQIDCWGTSYADARAAAQVLKKLLNGYTGTLPNGVAVENIVRDGEQSGFDSGPRSYYVQTDWMIWFTEP